MPELSKPSKELAAKVLRRMTFGERLSLAWHNGESDIQESMYSFEEAVHFLAMDENRLACSVDFDVLREWVEGTVGDAELAGAISGVTQKSADNTELIRAVKELMEQRLAQCQAILREVPA